MGLHLAPSAAARERQLSRLLAERGLRRDDPRLAALVEDALLVGSLGLAGIALSWDEARAGGDRAPDPMRALRRARVAVARAARLSPAVLQTWHAAIAGPAGWRRDDAPAAAPAAFVAERLESLCDWLHAPGSQPLGAEQKAAVALARIVEIRPFDAANGRIARLAAAHVMEQAGLPPPVLVAGDGARLREATAAAFRLETGSLVELVQEASGRALVVMIQSLERGLLEA